VALQAFSRGLRNSSSIACPVPTHNGHGGCARIKQSRGPTLHALLIPPRIRRERAAGLHLLRITFDGLSPSMEEFEASHPTLMETVNTIEEYLAGLPVGLSLLDEHRFTHTVWLGKTGSGKSTHLAESTGA
jgi:hypothetical protein